MSAPSGSPKAELRARMLAVRRGLDREERLRRGNAVADLVLALPEVRDARVVLAYRTLGAEVPAEELTSRLQALGTEVRLPVVDADGEMSADRGEDGEIQVVIAPGLAFDRGGARLGRGGGHYDRFLGRLGSGALRVGIGYAEQLVERVPVSASDQALDVVVTDAEVVRVARVDGPGGE